MKDTREFEITKYYLKGFMSLEKGMFPWCQKQKFFEPLSRSFHESELGRKFGSEDATIAQAYFLQCLYNATYTSSRFFARYRQEEGEYLNEDEKKVLDYYTKNPFSWSIASPVERRDDELFLMEDIISGERYELCSISVSRIQKDPKKRQCPLVILRLKSPGYWMAYGIVHPLPFSKDDIMVMLRTITEEKKIPLSSLVGEAVRKSYTDFFLIDRYTDVPGVSFKGENMMTCTKRVTDVLVEEGGLGQDWSYETRDGVIRCIPSHLPGVEDKDIPSFNVCLFSTPEKREIFIMCLNVSVMKKFLSHLRESCSLPLTSSFKSVSITMSVALNSIGYEMPAAFYENIFRREPTENEKRCVADLQKVSNIFVSAHNEGLTITDEEIAEKTGLPLPLVTSVCDTLRKIAQSHSPDWIVPPEDEQYLLPYPPLSPRQKSNFDNYPGFNAFLVPSSGLRRENAYRRFFSAVLVPHGEDDTPYELLRDEIENVIGGELGSHVANMLVYLLFLFHDKSRPARCYTISMMKEFGQFFPDSEEVIIRVNRLFATSLTRLGVVSIDHRPKGRELAEGLFLVKVNPWLPALFEIAP